MIIVSQTSSQTSSKTSSNRTSPFGAFSVLNDLEPNLCNWVKGQNLEKCFYKQFRVSLKIK